jgi:hypothetical protein
MEVANKKTGWADRSRPTRSHCSLWIRLIAPTRHHRHRLEELDDRHAFGTTQRTTNHAATVLPGQRITCKEMSLVRVTRNSSLLELFVEPHSVGDHELEPALDTVRHEPEIDRVVILNARPKDRVALLLRTEELVDAMSDPLCRNGAVAHTPLSGRALYAAIAWADAPVRSPM